MKEKRATIEEIAEMIIEGYSETSIIDILYDDYKYMTESDYIDAQELAKEWDEEFEEYQADKWQSYREMVA